MAWFPFLTALVGEARAICVDTDGDGWFFGGTCTGVRDCDDSSSPEINPAASEDGIDWVDDDCDDSPLTHRQYVVGFEVNYTADWNRTGTVTLVNPGTIRIGPGAASISLANDLPWATGEFTVVLRFAEALTRTCVLSVTGSAGTVATTLATSTGAVTQTIPYAHVAPGDTVTDLTLSCSGVGTSRLDWLTVQNGPYVWGPLMDIDVSFSTMGFPFAGKGSFIRMSEDSSTSDQIRMIGSDVGGLAWSEDGETWYTANGTQDDLNTQSLGGVWDAWSPEEVGGQRFAAILVGNMANGTSELPGEYGGLFYTEDLTDPEQTWTMVPPDPTGDPLNGGYGTSRKYDECTTLGGIPVASAVVELGGDHAGRTLSPRTGCHLRCYPEPGRRVCVCVRRRRVRRQRRSVPGRHGNPVRGDGGSLPRGSVAERACRPSPPACR